MNDILHANIFFIITSVAVVVLALMWVVILGFVIFILREVSIIVRRVQKASEDIEQDIQLLRANIKAGGERVRSLGSTMFEFLVRMLTAAPRRSQTRRPKPSAEEGDLVQ